METGGDSKIILSQCVGGIEAVIKRDPARVDELGGRLAAIEGLVRVCFMQPVSQLKDFSFLDGITTIRRLHFNASPVASDYSSLARIPQLNEITTGDRCWFDCAILSELTGLRTFRSGPKATNINLIGSCSTLEWVELRGAKSFDCSFVSGLAALNRLRLWDCDIVRSHGIDQCPLIARLDIGGSSLIEIEAVSDLARLDTLKLDGCKSITNPEPLKCCRSLRHLSVNNCKFDLFFDIFEPLEKLEVLNIVGIRVDRETIEGIARLPNLKMVSVSKKHRAAIEVLKPDIKVCAY